MDKKTKEIIINLTFLFLIYLALMPRYHVFLPTLPIYDNEEVKEVKNMVKKRNSEHLYYFTDARLMSVDKREGKNATFRNSLPVSNSLPKSIRDMPSRGLCAMWCSEVENCVFFEHLPNTRRHSDGVCIIRFN